MSRPCIEYTLNIAAFAALFVALVIPARLSWITPMSFVHFPLEALVLCLCLLLPGRAGTAIRWAAAVLLAAGFIFKLADMAAYEVFARQFNPVFDTYLLADGMNLLSGAIGPVGAVGAALLLGLSIVTLCLLAFAVMRRIQAVLQRHPRGAIATLSAIVLVSGALAITGARRISTLFYDQLAMHAGNTMTSIADIRSFRDVVNEDVLSGRPADSLFGALKGKDVLILFVESYGRSAIDDVEFGPHVQSVLETGNAMLLANGLNARSAWLTSPTVGGLSWLAHGTALSGLWIDSQVRYDSLIMSERLTLLHLFKRAGWRTVGVMPAITMVWPEGDYFGYDQIYAAADLGYAGLPFNWVTMPDQYVLSAFEARERSGQNRLPVVAEIALISSHAPWTPVPVVVPWDMVGDGSIFNAQALTGDAPDVVWRNNDRIREQYRKTIEYAITNFVSYAVTYGDEDLVLLIMGDHQPAPLVTRDDTNRDVPVHLIARDPAVLAAIADWQWTDGLLPAGNAPVWRMDTIRNRVVEAFSTDSLESGSAPIRLLD